MNISFAVWDPGIKRVLQQDRRLKSSSSSYVEVLLAFAFAVVNNLQSKLLIKLSNIIFMVSVMVSAALLPPLSLALSHSLAHSIAFPGKLVAFLWWQFNLLLWFYELLMR